MKPRHLSILYVLIPALAVLTTWATGSGKPGTGGFFEYGFPLPWKTVEIIPTCNGCPLLTSYTWSFFILDAAFYATIGYALVFLYTRRLWKKQEHLTDSGSRSSLRVPRN